MRGFEKQKQIARFCLTLYTVNLVGLADGKEDGCISVMLSCPKSDFLTFCENLSSLFHLQLD